MKNSVMQKSVYHYPVLILTLYLHVNLELGMINAIATTIRLETHDDVL